MTANYLNKRRQDISMRNILVGMLIFGLTFAGANYSTSTTTDTYTTIDSPIFAGFDLATILGLFCILIGLAGILIYALRYWGYHKSAATH